ncbi:MAG: hypothetical protein KF749_09155 [Bacteroidetes bacterium]|nr:hypothetical protein [Bacteroidota bacterium]MCW5894792.1 hypothetical protein [Bacteroidota bacterium]
MYSNPAEEIDARMSVLKNCSIALVQFAEALLSSTSWRQGEKQWILNSKFIAVTVQQRSLRVTINGNLNRYNSLQGLPLKPWAFPNKSSFVFNNAKQLAAATNYILQAYELNIDRIREKKLTH